ncbi:MAG: TRAP transporter small permease [Peptostreptococcaceae bacterium]|nr:TRAP transporter small permease [Peptostreptococcaceae bacterium]
MKDKKYAKTIEIQRYFNVCVVITISVMATLVFSNAILRYIFNTSIPETEEIARFCFIWTVFLGIIAAYKDGEHVSVDILVDNLTGIPKKAIKLIARAITFLALGIILYGGIIYTIYASTYNTAATGTNFALISIAIVIMAAAMIGLDLQKIYNSVSLKFNKMEKED